MRVMAFLIMHAKVFRHRRVVMRSSPTLPLLRVICSHLLLPSESLISDPCSLVCYQNGTVRGSLADGQAAPSASVPQPSGRARDSGSATTTHVASGTEVHLKVQAFIMNHRHSWLYPKKKPLNTGCWMHPYQ